MNNLITPLNSVYHDYKINELPKYNMAIVVHKLLIHGSQIIASSFLLIGLSI